MADKACPVTASQNHPKCVQNMSVPVGYVVETKCLGSDGASIAMNNCDSKSSLKMKSVAPISNCSITNVLNGVPTFDGNTGCPPLNFTCKDCPYERPKMDAQKYNFNAYCCSRTNNGTCDPGIMGSAPLKCPADAPILATGMTAQPNDLNQSDQYANWTLQQKLTQQDFPWADNTYNWKCIDEKAEFPNVKMCIAKDGYCFDVATAVERSIHCPQAAGKVHLSPSLR